MKIVKSGPFRVRLSAEKETRRERLKSALYLRLKKRKTLFWKKPFFEILEFFLSENNA